VSALSAWRARAIAQLIGVGVSEAEATEGCVWLLEDLAGLNRATQVTRPDLALSEQVVTLLNEALERRLRREPLSHILGSWSFWGLDFKVSRAVLTPRPDTEVLVEEALTWLKGTSSEVELIVDVCSGTSCVGLALASERAERVILIELCEEACVVLKDNARALNDQGLLRATVELRQGSLLAPLPGGPLLCVELLKIGLVQWVQGIRSCANETRGCSRRCRQAGGCSERQRGGRQRYRPSYRHEPRAKQSLYRIFAYTWARYPKLENHYSGLLSMTRATHQAPTPTRSRSYHVGHIYSLV